jgi:anti-sigma B factor antagonist
MAFNINTNTADDVNIVEVSGDIDGNTAPLVQEQVLALAVPGSKVILDMTGVEFMSSAGLRVMVLLYRNITDNNGQIVLVGLCAELQDTMSATGFLKFFTLCSTIDEALQVMA